MPISLHCQGFLKMNRKRHSWYDYRSYYFQKLGNMWPQGIPRCLEHSLYDFKLFKFNSPKIISWIRVPRPFEANIVVFPRLPKKLTENDILDMIIGHIIFRSLEICGHKIFRGIWNIRCMNPIYPNSIIWKSYHVYEAQSRLKRLITVWQRFPKNEQKMYRW